ncbi:MAG: hypothetical protein HOP17_02685 [Acidobacteria bacterium]|nr:hypothetical protein [Acidobacteriota bacterium]
MKNETFPEIPLEAWRPTKNTLHLYFQIVGKIRLAMHPRINHWWHVPLYVTPRGVSTHTIPYTGGNFEIEFDFNEHVLRISTSDKQVEDFALYDGLTVADFYNSLFANLAKLGIEPQIKAIPYEAPSTTPFAEDTENKSYDKEYVERFHRTLVTVDGVLNEFRGRFLGKSTPVHMFWHSFDLALTRFSGKRVPPREGAGMVEREAYSHEVISFGFWFGDDRVPAPAFYSYAAPEPAGLADEPLSPADAKWAESNGAHLALLMYEDVRTQENASEAVLDFLESAYQAGANQAGWDAKELKAFA